jgi:GNAT superfamily N-acetyltransferase
VLGDVGDPHDIGRRCVELALHEIVMHRRAWRLAVAAALLGRGGPDPVSPAEPPDAPLTDPVAGRLGSVSRRAEVAAHGRGRQGQRVGRALVEHLLAVAADRNFRRVSLETGIMEAFAPARSLYAQVGFSPCAPFADYVSSPTRPGMTIEIEPAAHTTDDERRAEGPSAGCCT